MFCQNMFALFKINKTIQSIKVKNVLQNRAHQTIYYLNFFKQTSKNVYTLIEACYNKPINKNLTLFQPVIMRNSVIINGLSPFFRPKLILVSAEHHGPVKSTKLHYSKDELGPEGWVSRDVEAENNQTADWRCNW